jgi:mannosyltransferase
MSSPEVILGNSNRRFSGVTSTMLQTLPEVGARMPTAVLGRRHLPEGTTALGYAGFIRLCRSLPPSGLPRVFHARRNNEMIQALIARGLSGAGIRILFTSTAQRHHTWITRWLIRRMDGILTTSTAAGSYLQRPADRIIPHGVPLDVYHPPSSRAEAWQALGLPGKFGVGIFGRVRPQKGTDLLVDAVLPLLSEYPDPTVVIVGETTPKFRDYRRRLEERIARAGLGERVVFLGKRPAGELPKLIRAMSLVTALSRNEGFGLTVLEAMGSGCAVLATKAGAWQDVIRDEIDGYLLPCDDVDAIRKKLDHLFRQPDLLAVMGKAGRERAEAEYSVEREAAALCDYYRQLQQSGSDAPS